MNTKSLDSLTTTEKLLIATAFDLYDDISEISLYLRYNNVNINNIKEIHSLIKNESLRGGYSSAVDYCQDKRYLKAICEYEKYKKLIYDVLENKVNYEDIDIPEDKSIDNENCKYETVNIPEFMDVKKSELEINDFITENLQTVEVIENQNLQIEPKNINNKIINKSRMESPKNLKDKKRFYLRMDEEEKVIDDYFDYLDMKNTEGKKDLNNLGKRSKALEVFPLLVKGKEQLVEKEAKKAEKKIEKEIKKAEKKVEKTEKKVEKIDLKTDDLIKEVKQDEKQEEKEFMREEKEVKKEIKKEVKKEIKKEVKKDKIVLETPFDILMHKIQTTKKQDKDKTLWRSELKIIVDHLAPIFGKDGQFDFIYEEMEGNTLQYSIMNMMLIIQDCIIQEDDDEVLDEYCEYKRKLAAFCDYYKK